MPIVTHRNRRYEVYPGETMLAALLRQGCEIPFSCRKGSCTVCIRRCEDGDVPAESQLGLPSALRENRYFLPCICVPTSPMSVEAPRPQDLSFIARIVTKTELAPDVLGLFLEPARDMAYRSGQFINLTRDDGLTRSYSLASVDGEEPYLELHVRLVPQGAMSQWLLQEAQVGDEITLSGPFGENFYRSAEPTSDVVLIGSGTGLAPLYGIAKNALFSGHEGDIHLYHAGATRSDLYLYEKLLRLSEEFSRFQYHPACVEDNDSLNVIDSVPAIADRAFQEQTSIDSARVHVAGRPDFVRRCLDLAAEYSLRRGSVLADSFESGEPGQDVVDEPDSGNRNDENKEEIGPRRFPPDPEMWEALDDGRLLHAILDDFYSRAFEDPVLSPYFHGVSKRRVSEKVYSYLRQAFTGERHYFGNHPRNAHHWMVIDNDIFDYRELLLVDCIRRHGLPEHLIERWRALEEQFRGDIVKRKPRGRIIDGQTLPVGGFRNEVLDVGTLCDGCGVELSAGVNVRYHLRLGTVYGDCCHQEASLAEAG